jgi:hypothetical protein
MNLVINLHVPYNAGKLSSGYATGDLLSDAQPHRKRERETGYCHFIFLSDIQYPNRSTDDLNVLSSKKTSTRFSVKKSVFLID